MPVPKRSRLRLRSCHSLYRRKLLRLPEGPRSRRLLRRSRHPLHRRKLHLLPEGHRSRRPQLRAEADALHLTSPAWVGEGRAGGEGQTKARHDTAAPAICPRPSRTEEAAKAKVDGKDLGPNGNGSGVTYRQAVGLEDRAAALP